MEIHECKTCEMLIREDKAMCHECETNMIREFIEMLNKFEDYEIDRIDELIDGKYLKDFIKENK